MHNIDLKDYVVMKINSYLNGQKINAAADLDSKHPFLIYAEHPAAIGRGIILPLHNPATIRYFRRFNILPIQYY